MQSEVFFEKSSWNKARERLNRQRSQGLFTDIEIETSGGYVINAHRSVLSAVFPRLERVMTSLTTNRLQWLRFGYDVVMAAVDFAYTGRVELTLDNAVPHLLFSVNLNCAQLRDWCIQFLTSHGRISGENVSQIWAAANSILNEQLMRACVEVMRVQMERINRDLYTWSHTSAWGMRLLLEGDHNSTSKQALDFWIHLEESDDNRKNKLCNLIGNWNLEVLSFDTLLFIHSKGAELRIVQNYRDNIEDALRSGNLRNVLQAGPSTSQSTSTITTSSSNQPKHQILAIGDLNSTTGTGVLKNVPEFQSEPAVQQTLPFRTCCRYVLFRDWVCTLGGCSADYKQSYSTFDIYNLKTSKQFKGPPMLKTRDRFSAVATSDRIFVLGGVCSNTNISSCEYYESNRNSWISLPNLPSARGNTSAVHVPGEGIIVVGGGAKDQDKILRYDDAYLLLFKSNGGSERSWSWQYLPSMLQGRSSPGIAYHNGRVFVAGCWSSQHFDVESLRYPTRPNETPQWTFVSLLEISQNLPVSLIELSGQLMLINGDGQILRYREVPKSNGTMDAKWKSKCRLKNSSYSNFFIRIIN